MKVFRKSANSAGRCEGVLVRIRKSIVVIQITIHIGEVYSYGHGLFSYINNNTD